MHRDDEALEHRAEGGDLNVLGRHDHVAFLLLCNDFERELLAQRVQIEARIDLQEDWDA